MSLGLSSRRCAELAEIVGGTPAFAEGVCLIQLLRADLSPTILGCRTRSPLVLPVFFSVEECDGSPLNLGESVLRQEEVNTVMKVLRDNGIIVTAVHNHWLFEEPRLMYMHWEARMDPVRFLRVSLAALEAAGVRTRPLSADGDDCHGKRDHHAKQHVVHKGERHFVHATMSGDCDRKRHRDESDMSDDCHRKRHCDQSDSSGDCHRKRHRDHSGMSDDCHRKRHHDESGMSDDCHRKRHHDESGMSDESDRKRHCDRCRKCSSKKRHEVRMWQLSD